MKRNLLFPYALAAVFIFLLTSVTNKPGSQPWLTYCSTVANNSHEYIYNVRFGSINNTGTDAGYGNFTNLSTSVTAGATYNIKLTPGFRYVNPTIGYQAIVSGLSKPVEVVSSHDGTGRLFIVQQGGQVLIWDGKALKPRPFLNIRPLLSVAGGEQGMLSMTFHPQYKSNGYFFVYYTNPSNAITIARYHVSATNKDSADAASGVVLLTIPKMLTNHNGGHLDFSPTDGDLYFATGDGGGANDPDNNAQNGSVLLGKMIRMNVNNFTTAPYYTIPADNPYITKTGFNKLVFNYGLRNPFRWSFDRANGDLWIGDVGQDSLEEVDYRPVAKRGGNNFGWRCYEGTVHTPAIIPSCSPPDHVPPIFTYPNPNRANPPSTAVTGGFVYRGTEFPLLQGYYIATDVYLGNIYLIKPNGNGGWIKLTQTGGQTYIVSFGEADNGDLYAVSQGTNTLYKVVVSSPVENWKVYIDFNQNGKLNDPGEMFTVGTSAAVLSFPIKIPATAKNGATRMRVQMTRTSISDPCVSYTNGDIQDYTLQISGGTAAVTSILNETTIDQTHTETNSVQITPDPVTSEAPGAVYNLAKDGPVVLKIVSVDGKIIYTANLGAQNAGTHRFLLSNLNSHLASGYYMIVMEQDGAIIARNRFVKQ